jgi:hypothetical protein
MSNAPDIRLNEIDEWGRGKILVMKLKPRSQ